MKKILSRFTAVVSLVCFFTGTASANEKLPTKEEYDNIHKTADFICDIYLAEGMLYEYGGGYGNYIFMILFEAAEAYPENTEYGENDTDRDWPLAVRLTEEEAISVIKQKFSYIADETLEDKYISIILEYLKDNGFVLSNPGVSSITYNDNAIKGGFKGYKGNADNTFSFFFSLVEVVDPGDVLGGEDYKEFERLASEYNGVSFEYKGYTFDYDLNGYHTYRDSKYREFNFSLTDDGKVRYNYDRWDVIPPVEYDRIPAVPGDMNCDDEIDNKDVVILFRAVSGSAGEYDAAYDFNEDGEVNNKDVVALFRFVSAAK